MKTLYFDCGMGAAGDMLTAALLELCDDKEKTVEELNALGIPGVRFELQTSSKCGITGSHMSVLVDGEEEDEHMYDHHHHDHQEHEHHHDHEEHGHHHHHHTGMHGIEHIVKDHIHAPEKVKEDVMAVYQLIAEAESKVHNTTIEEIHFHEVGTKDAIADITAVCYLIHKLQPEKILASPIHVGKGTVRCAHGILPVPAPATALLLSGIPVYSREEINGELCTPTGAALLKHFVHEFKPMPVLTIRRIGYGMGKKDFPIANCVRAILAETEDASRGMVIELDFNVDDMTGEQVGYATEALLKAGAYEVFVTPVYMKKNRPGSLISLLCSESNKEEMVRIIFKETTTIGIRETIKSRYILQREIEKVETEFGTIRRKNVHGYGTSRSKYEFDDLKKIADENDLSLSEVLKKIG